MTEERIRQAVCAELVRLLSGERKRQGVSMNALAGRAGLSQSFISMFESQPANPTVDTLLRICRVLEVNLGDLLSQAIGNVGPSSKVAQPRRASRG